MIRRPMTSRCNGCVARLVASLVGKVGGNGKVVVALRIEARVGTARKRLELGDLSHREGRGMSVCTTCVRVWLTVDRT